MSFLLVFKRWCVNAASLVLHFAHGGLVVTGLLVAGYAALGISQFGLQGPWLTGLIRGGDAVPDSLAWAGDDNLAADNASHGGPVLSLPMQRVATYLSRRYKVSREGVEPLVASAEDVGKRIGLDPLLLVAVMAVESSFNPLAESPMGAQGLMQVIPRFHQEKLVDQGDGASLLNPETNILVGARVLKEYLTRTGSLELALHVYNGASTEATGSLYANKVLAEKQRLEAAAQARRLVAIPVPAQPVARVQRTIQPVEPAAVAPALPGLLQGAKNATTVADATPSGFVAD